MEIYEVWCIGYDAAGIDEYGENYTDLDDLIETFETEDEAMQFAKDFIAAADYLEQPTFDYLKENGFTAKVTVERVHVASDDDDDDDDNYSNEIVAMFDYPMPA